MVLPINDLLEEIEPVEEQVSVSLPRHALEHLGFVMQLSPEVAIAELLRRSLTSSNGHSYEVICAGCGIPFQSNRRPLPGKKRWCENCRKTGEPAAQRARDYRQRKHQ